MKEKIRRHLEHLEKAGVVSRRNNYQNIINSIVQVRNDLWVLIFIRQDNMLFSHQKFNETHFFWF